MRPVLDDVQAGLSMLIAIQKGAMACSNIYGALLWRSTELIDHAEFR